MAKASELKNEAETNLDKPYYCTECKRNHTKGKIFKEHLKFAKYEPEDNTEINDEKETVEDEIYDEDDYDDEAELIEAFEELDEKEMEDLVGKTTARDLEEKSLAVYQYAQAYAQERGIIIADTKFEFGVVDGKLIIIDELLTPDSSRFWDATQYTVGRSQPSFDKQPVRDWLEASGWSKEPPAPVLPPEVIKATTSQYVEAYQRLTGRTLQDVSS